MTEFLDLDDLLELAAALLGDPPPIRDLGLLAAAHVEAREQVAVRHDPRQGVGGPRHVLQ